MKEFWLVTNTRTNELTDKGLIDFSRVGAIREGVQQGWVEITVGGSNLVVYANYEDLKKCLRSDHYNVPIEGEIL